MILTTITPGAVAAAMFRFFLCLGFTAEAAASGATFPATVPTAGGIGLALLILTLGAVLLQHLRDRAGGPD